jgi:hypothetical protein
VEVEQMPGVAEESRSKPSWKLGCEAEEPVDQEKGAKRKENLSPQSQVEKTPDLFCNPAVAGLQTAERLSEWCWGKVQLGLEAFNVEQEPWATGLETRSTIVGGRRKRWSTQKSANFPWDTKEGSVILSDPATR